MTDLRLVPAATAAWLACAVAVAWSAATAGRCAAGLLVVAALGARWALSRPRAAAAWLALVAAGLALGSCATQLARRDGGALTDLADARATVTLTGVVRSEAAALPAARDESATWFVLGATSVSGRGRVTGAAALVVVIADAGAPYGSTISVTGRLAPADPGEDAVAVLRATGPVRVDRPPGLVDRRVGEIRTALLAVSDDLPPDARGLVPGVAVGDTSRMPPDLAVAMRDVGLTHATAVSGGHFAVLTVTVVALAGLLRLPRPVRAAVTAAATVGFVLLVHPQPSVLRAAVMGGLAVLGMMLGRPSRTVPGLAVAVLGLVLVDPWLARSVGFVLSVLATGGIALLAPVIAGWLEALPRRLALALAVPAAAQAVCGPVLVLVDPAVGTYAVPANLLALPALLPATVLGVGGALLAPVCAPLATLAVRGAGVATWWIATVARVGSGLPGARHPWPEGAAGALALAAVTACGLAVVPAARRWGARPVVAVVVVVGLAVIVLRPLLAPTGAWPPPGWRYAACDVGQGDATVIRSGPGAAVVIDAGPPGDAAGECLDRLGVRRIDLLVLTHPHDDHVGGLAGVLRGRDVVAAVVGPAGAGPDTGRLVATGAPVRALAVGMVGAAGTAGDVAWTVLSPRAGAVGTADAAVNDASLVLLLRAPDLTVLALGDAEPGAQDALARRLARQPGLLAGGVDVLKVAHHGSAHQSPALLGLLRPSVAVVSVGADNDYGHPAPATLEALRAGGALVRTTSECGAVTIGRAPSGALVVTGRCAGG